MLMQGRVTGSSGDGRLVWLGTGNNTKATPCVVLGDSQCQEQGWTARGGEIPEIWARGRGCL